MVGLRVTRVGLAVALITSQPGLAQDFNGRVVSISDGETISVMHDRRAEKIRLYGIDAPEKGQASGNKAKQFVAVPAFGKVVNVGAKE